VDDSRPKGRLPICESVPAVAVLSLRAAAQPLALGRAQVLARKPGLLAQRRLLRALEHLAGAADAFEQLASERAGKPAQPPAPV
jgi:hypothetical protein